MTLGIPKQGGNHGKTFNMGGDHCLRTARSLEGITWDRGETPERPAIEFVTDD